MQTCIAQLVDSDWLFPNPTKHPSIQINPELNGAEQTCTMSEPQTLETTEGRAQLCTTKKLKRDLTPFLNSFWILTSHQEATKNP